MKTFTINTDGCHADIDAKNVDAACAEFAQSEGIKNVKNLAGLEAHIRRVGGYMTILDKDGAPVSRIK
jgi:hypothetical protein